jgi:hypothetical protein
MSKLKNSYVNSTILGGQNISVGYDLVDINKDLIEYIEFAFQIMGIDLTYEDFKRMSSDEKISFLRDIKINKIL